jgi:mono/diheme cytochrome c family protein
MISARMSRAARALLAITSSFAVAAVTTACGTEKIKVSQSAGDVYRGAVLFNQRCSGCHTLAYAATHGSAANVRTAEFNNGPNFDVRCERPVTRVMYAIENGGFSGAIMPQNIVVGQNAIDVAEFVAKYAGRQAPKVPGSVQCTQKPIGSIPSPTATTAAAASGTTGATGASGTTGATGASGAKKSTGKQAGAKSKPRSKKKRKP